MGIIKRTPVSQSSKIIMLTKRAFGATNWELSRVSLKYSSRIAELRQDGYNIVAQRQRLKNGRASNTWRYYLTEKSQ